jgi:spermidine synthase
MKPWVKLAEAETPGGSCLTLQQRDREYVIAVDGKQLMSSRMHASEESLAEVGCEALSEHARPCVLIGGLGMGFTLRAALDRLPRQAEVVVAELVPALVEWNRGPLAALAGRPLFDRRVDVVEEDVVYTLRKHVARFDAVLLDVDNGPRGLTDAKNDRIYGEHGLASAKASLAPGGKLVVWSAGEDARFVKRLEQCGFTVEVRRVKGRAARGAPTHVLFVATAPSPRRPR